MINYDELLKKPEFEALESERKEALRQLMIKLDGKSTMEAMSIIMEFGRNMPKGKEISKQEQSAMMRAILENMEDKEKQKYSVILRIMGLD